MIHQPTVHVWTKFQLCVPLSPWEKKDEFFIQISLCITLEWEMEKTRNLSFVFCLSIYLATLNVYTKSLIEAKKYMYVTENLLGEKEKWLNKGMISSSMLIHFCTIQQVIPKFVPNFKILGTVVPEKSPTQIFLCITLELEMEKWKKKAKFNHRILVFFPKIYLASQKVYTKFEDSGCKRSWEFCDEKLYWRERKMDK